MLRNCEFVFFYVSGTVSIERVARLVGLASGPPLDEVVVGEMKKFLSLEGFTFSILIMVDSREATRVVFYALRLRAGYFPGVEDCLTRFFERTPSYDSRR